MKVACICCVVFFAAIIVLTLYSACRVSGKCSREEEREEMEARK